MWSEGSGLFDLSNLKSGDKSKLESIHNPMGSANNNGGSNLLTSGDELNKIWGNSTGGNTQGFGSANNNGQMGGFGM